MPYGNSCSRDHAFIAVVDGSPYASIARAACGVRVKEATRVEIHDAATVEQRSTLQLMG